MNADRLREIYDAVAPMAPGERAAYLDRACAGDVSLRERVEALLRQEAEADAFFATADLQAPLAQAARDGDTLVVGPNEQPGTMIGHYKLLEQIGEGGFGAVWVAEQREPVRRRVALKIVKLGMDTRQVVARFEAERQALAMMDHLNIAKVFDAAATDTGRPYFVMELVRGSSITQFCDDRQLPTGQRLGLFIQVCQAVQHAHQKGIIHRDLKPSNILVTLHDGVPVPKVIDFGIAKAMHQELTDKTVYTLFQQFLGTPAYVSPEQVELSGLDMDTRSDIYSLGVLLYELLTGRPPFDPKELVEAGLEAMRRTIREKEPLRPSTRLGTLEAAELTTTAQRRGAEPPKLIHLLRGDLDWIVMKCLEKDRSRRYETAAALAQDLEHHLKDEPVLARPPTVSYRLRKFAQRNRSVVLGTGAVFGALLAGLLLAVIGWSAARRGEARAWRAEQTAQAQRKRAELSELEARRMAYASDVKATQSALQQGNLDLAKLLLSRHRPRPGATELRGIEWRHLWRQAQGGDARRFSHPPVVVALALSPDGRWLVSAGTNFVLWDVATGQRLGEWNATGPFGPAPNSVAFSHDGKWLAHAATNRIQVRETVGWTVVHEVNGAGPPLCFSPSGRLLAARAPNGLGLWNISDWSGLTLTNASPIAGSLAFGSTENDLACPVIQGPSRLGALWNLRAEEATVLPFFPMAVSPDGNWVGGENESGDAWLAEWHAGKPAIRHTAHRTAIQAMAFSPDGRWRATGGSDQAIHLWETGSSNRVATFRGHTGTVSALAFSRDGQQLISGGSDGTVRFWNLRADAPGQPTGQLSLPLPTNAVSWCFWAAPIGFLPDGNAMLVGTYETGHRTRARACRLPGGEVLSEQTWLDFFERRGWTGWQLFPEHGQVLGVTPDGVLHFWDLTGDVEVRKVLLRIQPEIRTWTNAYYDLRGTNPVVSQVSGTNLWPRVLSGDQRWLVGTEGRLHGPLLLCDLTGTHLAQTLPDSGFDTTYSFAAFSADNRWLAYPTASAVRLWNLARQAEERMLRGPRTAVRSLGFSPDGRWLAGGCWDGDVWLWPLETGDPAHSPMRGHQAFVFAVCFSADARTLISSAADETTRWWSVATGQEMVLEEHTGLVISPRLERRLPWAANQLATLWYDSGAEASRLRVTMLPGLAEIDRIEAAPVSTP